MKVYSSLSIYTSVVSMLLEFFSYVFAFYVLKNDVYTLNTVNFEDLILCVWQTAVSIQGILKIWKFNLVTVWIAGIGEFL